MPKAEQDIIVVNTKREFDFYSPDARPKYANQGDYILLVEITGEGENLEGDEEFIMAHWIDGEWWVYAENYENEEIVYGEVNGEPLRPILFEKFEEGFFKIIGWRPLFGGSHPCA